jgi:hypothetical protein
MRRTCPGASLIEFAIVMPLLTTLIIGGICLLIRLTVYAALDDAASQAAWAAARGGDARDVARAIAASLPFARADDVEACVASGGYHQDVIARVAYNGSVIASLPFFNDPLPPAVALTTNQQERSFAFGFRCTIQFQAQGLDDGSAGPDRPRGPAAWPQGGRP